MTELSKCLLGTSEYCHADKVVTLYRILDHLGNSKEWQLHILSILQEGIEAKIEEERKALNCLLNRPSRRGELDQRGF